MNAAALSADALFDESARLDSPLQRMDVLAQGEIPTMLEGGLDAPTVEDIPPEEVTADSSEDGDSIDIPMDSSESDSDSLDIDIDFEDDP